MIAVRRPVPPLARLLDFESACRVATRAAEIIVAPQQNAGKCSHHVADFLGSIVAALRDNYVSALHKGTGMRSILPYLHPTKEIGNPANRALQNAVAAIPRRVRR